MFDLAQKPKVVPLTHGTKVQIGATPEGVRIKVEPEELRSPVKPKG